MDVVGGLVGKVRGVVNAVVSAVNGVIGRINSALEFSTPGLTIAGRTIVPSASFDAPDIPYVGGMAAGGPVRGRTPYMVGERGPELFVPGRSGSIVPNHALAAGGVTVNIYAPIGSERDLENMVVSALTNVRNRGGLS
jgi:phage-related minor tail protein